MVTVRLSKIIEKIIVLDTDHSSLFFYNGEKISIFIPSTLKESSTEIINNELTTW